ncbi:hypothetical protein LUZ60_001851 [Juncus effusus]|nr:hypothetical protein LUZ60_001851 [Juncus effusus]
MEKMEDIREVDPREEHERKGTVYTATSHIVTAVIGSGVLALAWSIAQLGWIVGIFALVGFACVTYYTSTLLADSYRAPDPVTGSRNRTYMTAVRSYLSPTEVYMCGVAQYVNLWGCMVGYTITATISMIAIKRSNCFHRYGHSTDCNSSGTILMLIFGLIEVIFSQFPSMEKITWLSVMAAVMSFAYSFIGLGLSIAKWVSNGYTRGRLTGVTHLSSAKKTWNVLQALGNIAFAYTFAEVLIEIQDTLKSSPPENITMKKATLYGIGATTLFYLSLGITGYGAFGNDAPGNILTGFGFYDPFWLVDIGNLCIILHLFGAYQVYAQPIFAAIEMQIAAQWPDAKFINRVYTLNVRLFKINFTLSKLVLRTIIILLTTLVAMMIPFFNAVLGLLGALSFWPLTVYFPIKMHLVQERDIIKMPKWIFLQSLSAFCLVMSIAVSVGSVVDIVSSLKISTPFKTMG